VSPPRGATLLVSLLVVYLLVLSGRDAFREKGSPAVSIEKNNNISVLLEDGFPLAGVYQFSDGSDLVTVIQLTILPSSPLILSCPLPPGPLEDGLRLGLVLQGNEIKGFSRGWMPAAQRIALGIKLHPDRMSQEDWEVLPGVGTLLADRIEEDRQKNGDFVALDSLKRVPGIGNMLIERWREFF